MRIYIFFLIFLVSTLLFGQTTQFGFGLRTDSYTILGNSPIHITDSILVANYESISNPANGTIRGDARFTFFLERQVIEGQRGTISVAINYSRQWPQIGIGRVVDDPTSPFPVTFYTPVVARSEIFVPIQASVKPFDDMGMFSSIRLLKSVSLGMGIGPSLNFGRLTSRIDGYELNLRNKREDPQYYETYYQFGINSFRTLVFNYIWFVQTELFWRINLRIAGQGSLGSVSKPFSVFGEKYQVPLKRRGLAFLLTYSFTLPSIK